MNKQIIFGIILIGMFMMMPAASAIKTWSYPMAGFRVVHAVSDANGATIYAQANNRPVEAVIENIQYKQATQYYDVRQGNRKIWIGPTDDNRVKIEQSINLRSGQGFSLFLLGTRADGVKAILSEDFNEYIPASKAVVRFVNGAPGRETLNLATVVTQDSFGESYVNAGGKYLRGRDVVKVGTDNAIIRNLRYGQMSTYKQMDPGIYDFIFQIPGANTATVKISNVQLLRGTVYTFVAAGHDGSEYVIAVDAKTSGR